VATTFDASTAAPGIVLSNGNLTATAGSGVSDWVKVRATGTVHTTGKWAVEVTGINISGLSNGTIMGAEASRDRAQWCIDTDNKLVWIKRYYDTQWNGSGTADPVAGVGGIPYTLTGPIFAASAQLTYSAYTETSLTFNFGASAFLGTVPTGFTAWGSSDTLDPSHKSANITLSTDNLTAYNTSQSGAWEGVRSIGSHSTGKWYFETSFCGYARGDLVLDGLCNASYTYGFLGDGSSCVCWDCDDALYGFSGGPGNLTTKYGFLESYAGAFVGGNYPDSSTRSSGSGLQSTSGGLWGAYGGIGTSGTVYTGINSVMICVDLDAKLIWFIGDNNVWNEIGTANPATGVGGCDISAMSLDTFAWAVSFIAANNSVTFNFGASTPVRTVPAGFTMWDGSPVTPSAQLPYSGIQDRLRRHATDYARKPFAGRGERPATARHVLPPSLAPSYDRAQRQLRANAAHYAPGRFAGRGVRPAATIHKPPPYTGPIRGLRDNLLKDFAANFGHKPFRGRRLPRPDMAVYGGGTNIPPRASQIVTEVLQTGEAGGRASQVVEEALLKREAGLRASQVVAETLYQQTNPTYIRASQIVVEALVPNIAMSPILVYPELIGLTPKIVKRPKWSSGVATGSSGREVRIGYWSLPQWEWDLNYDILNDNISPGGHFNGTTASDLKTLIGFILTVFGSLQPFYFRDPDDNEVTGQALGIGDGATTAFQFVRTYGLGSFEGTEPVGSVNEGEPIAIYLNGTLQETGFTISTATPYSNTITFNTAPAPGAAITADFQFYYFCRLNDDKNEFSKGFPNLWANDHITIFSLKN
jgi:uncharacterized protein (TIGR02217 family)